jgi:WhiB family redox-sensing transcriptional regulator
MPQTPVYRLDVITETGSFVYRKSFSSIFLTPREGSVQQDVIVGELPRRKAYSDEWTWQLFGSCREIDVDVFFPPPDEPELIRAEREAIAKKACSTCPVRDACLRHALASDEDYGIWGGTSESERASAIRAVRRRFHAA